MKKCIEKLKVVEANRAAVVSELKEALQEQVGKTRSLTSYDAFSFFLEFVFACHHYLYFGYKDMKSYLFMLTRNPNWRKSALSYR